MRDQARAAAALRLRRNRDAGTVHSVLLWHFPVYILSLIVVYFVGAMIAFVFLYWGTHAVSTWPQALVASGSALNTLALQPPQRSSVNGSLFRKVLWGLAS